MSEQNPPCSKTDTTIRNRAVQWDSAQSTYDYRQGRRRSDLSVSVDYCNDELRRDTATLSFLVAGRQSRETWLLNRDELLAFAEMFQDVATHLPVED